jgi:SnoaL-like domain
LSTITTTAGDGAPAGTASGAAERWVEHFIEGWRAPSGPEAFAAHFRRVLAPDVRLIQPQLPDMVGLRAFDEQFVQPLFALLPDVHGVVEHWAASDEVIYIELTVCGTVGGRRPVTWRVCDRVTLHDGLAAERESYFDPSPLLAAIARTPRAWPSFLRVQLRRIASQLPLTRRKS